MSSAEVSKIKIPVIKNLKLYLAHLSSLPFFVPRTYVREVDHGPSFPVTKKTYDLSVAQQIFVTFDYPVSSVLASLYSSFMVVIILLSVIVYVLTTDSSVKYSPDTCDYPACDNDPDLCPSTVVCEPIDKQILDQLELSCLCIFVFDYGIRIMTCAFNPGRLLSIMPHNWDQVTNVYGNLEDPEYAPHHKLLLYVLKGMNLVDITAIITGFFAFYSSNETGNSKGLAIARVLRLVRVFRVFKVAGMSKGVPLFVNTIKRSGSAVRVMFFFSILAVIVFGSVMYYVESGEFEVTEEYPQGVYLRWDYVRNQKEISPFGSILLSMYWAVVTTTTVGYGDFHPTTGFGRFLSCVYMYFGIIMLALPISVVGANFQREYETLYPDYIEKELKRHKQRAALGHVAPLTPATTTPNPLHAQTLAHTLTLTQTQAPQSQGEGEGMDVELTSTHTGRDRDHGNSNGNDGHSSGGGGGGHGRDDDLHEKMSAMDAKLSILIDEIRNLKKELVLARSAGDSSNSSSSSRGEGSTTDDKEEKVEAY